MEEVDFEKVTQIFVPEVAERFKRARESKIRFVQYTSAAAAINIIRSESVWLRNTNCMNDFMEIEFGVQKIIGYFGNEKGKNLWDALDLIKDGISDEIKKKFDAWRHDLTENTYVACVSEHHIDEDDNGRLSMWRAYAKNSGVAVIINPTAMLSESDATRAYTFPVFYKTDSELDTFFEGFVKRIIEFSDFLKNAPSEIIKNYTHWFLQTCALCLKHPAFKEEREWRIVFRPNEYSDGKLLPKVEIINGVPQRLYALSLKNYPDQNFIGVEVNELIERILIGPTEHPLPIFHALVDMLKEKNVENPEMKIHITHIPLRLG